MFLPVLPFMERNGKIHAVESNKSVAQFVEDFCAVVKANDFVVNNPQTMNMQDTFSQHGGGSRGI